MRRPVMDPLFVKPFETPKRSWVLTVWAKSALRWLLRAMVSRPLAFYRPGAVRPPARPIPEFLRAAACQLVFLPLATALAAAALVYFGTHPARSQITKDPSAVGVYFEQVTFNSEDSTALAGWLAPALDARRVLVQKNRVLRAKDPAVILVHDFGQSPQQFLPLIAPLHEEGMVVLAIGLRGIGTSNQAGQTFGLNESADIRAAVDFLRNRPQVDRTRIAVVGVGTGASATLLAAQRDGAIKALVIADPVQSFDDLVVSHLGPKQSWVKWMRPECKWAFEMIYHVTADDLNFDRVAQVVRTRPTLVLPGGSNRAGYFDKKVVARVQFFLHEQLRPTDSAIATTEH